MDSSEYHKSNLQHNASRGQSYKTLKPTGFINRLFASKKNRNLSSETTPYDGQKGEYGITRSNSKHNAENNSNNAGFGELPSSSSSDTVSEFQDVDRSSDPSPAPRKQKRQTKFIPKDALKQVFMGTLDDVPPPPVEKPKSINKRATMLPPRQSSFEDFAVVDKSIMNNNRMSVFIADENQMPNIDFTSAHEINDHIEHDEQQGESLRREDRHKYRKSKFPEQLLGDGLNLADRSTDAFISNSLPNSIEPNPDTTKFSFIDDDILEVMQKLSPDTVVPSQNMFDIPDLDVKPLQMPYLDSQSQTEPARQAQQELSLVQEIMKVRSETPVQNSSQVQSRAPASLPVSEPPRRVPLNGSEKKFMVSGKAYISGDRLIHILCLHTSSVVNGGAFKKQENSILRKPIRVQFSGYDEVIPNENEISENNGSLLSPLSTLSQDSPSYTPVESPSSPVNAEQKKRREIVAPENFEFPLKPTVTPDSEKKQFDSSPNQKIHAPSTSSPLRTFEKNLPSRPEDHSSRLREQQSSDTTAPLPPPIATSQLNVNPALPEELTPPKEKKKKIKRRHIQIQARPVEFRTVGVQVGASSNDAFDEMTRELEKELATLNENGHEWRAEKSNMVNEIGELRVALREAHQKLEIVSNQAYQKMIGMMQEKQEMESEITELYERLHQFEIGQ